MNKSMKRFLSLAVILFLPAISRSARAAATTQPTSEPAIVAQHPALFLVGDSLMKTGTGNGEKGPRGLGQELAPLFDPAKIHVYNMGEGGRSSRLYMEEGFWKNVMDQLQPGDFLIIQFGHNDADNSANYPDRSTITGNGEETIVHGVKDTKNVIHTYGWYLRKYVADAKSKGATPILCSPVPRNVWPNGKIRRGFDGYAEWAEEAAKQSGAFFLDLNNLAADGFDALGQDKGQTYFIGNQHTTKAGAKLNADAAMRGLRMMKDCPLGDDLLPDGAVGN
jgi:rhamnogalacturonan acetylesterase